MVASGTGLQGLIRSNNGTNTNGGVSYVNANNDASNANWNRGSSLKYQVCVISHYAERPNIAKI